MRVSRLVRIPSDQGLRTLGLVLLLSCPALLTATPAALTDPHWISFHSARAVPSALARRALGDAVAAARPREVLRGLMVVPAGAGPFPAVVMVHGCRGVLAGQRGWAQWLAQHGYVTLLVDSFFTRHASGVCSLRPGEGARQEVSGRVFDAFGALDYLRRDPRVDAARVAIMGWNTWIPLSAVSRGGPRALVDVGFSAAVAISPDCPRDADDPVVPVLVLVGADDELHPAARCQQLAARFGGALTLRVLEGAGHGFDDVSAQAGPVTKAVFHLASAADRQIPVRYHRGAHEQAAHEVLAFLSPRLGARVDGDGPPPAAVMPEGAHWAVDPSRPGPDRPPAGRSLFDRVFADADGQVRVPFPFSRVLDRLAGELGGAPGSREGLTVSLIPIGRSLQRAAAAPEFFRYPRVVVAVDGEPRLRPAVRWLKDRLFLGYQEKARVIEAISYNEIAGRFEFQVVENYAPGETPRVRYANRTVCMSCHQNGAPIFPRAAWDETNNNTDVALRLRDAGGIPPGVSGAPVAALFDNATDRANLLPALQRVWDEGCGRGDVAGRACRGGALVAMIQERLSGSSGHDRDAARYREDFLAPLARSWRARWPGGLAIPDPDLVNREPMLDPTPTEIAPGEDPLTPRPPAALWHAVTDAWRLITELAQSLAQVDLQVLDRHLLDAGRRNARPRQIIATACRVSRRGVSAGHHRVTLGCKGPGSDQEPGDAGRLAPSFELDLDVRGGDVLGGTARYLELGDGVLLERVRLVPVASGPGRVALGLRQGQTGWSVRTVRGNAVDRVELDWARVETAAGSGEAVAGLATVEIVEDFQPVVAAVADLVAADRAVALDAGPFRPLLLMRAILDRVGIDHPAWCCENPVTSEVETRSPGSVNFLAAIPSARFPASAEASAVVVDDGVLAAFNRRCGACHRAPAPMPPGFLHGPRAGVEQALLQCAPRIALRLSMWRRAPEARLRSPMPPPMLLAGQGLDEAGWVTSEDYRLLLEWARSRAGEPGGEALPDCQAARGTLVRSSPSGG